MSAGSFHWRSAARAGDPCVPPGSVRLEGQFCGVVTTAARCLELTMPIVLEVPLIVLKPALDVVMAIAEAQEGAGRDSKPSTTAPAPARAWRELRQELLFEDREPKRSLEGGCFSALLSLGRNRTDLKRDLKRRDTRSLTLIAAEGACATTPTEEQRDTQRPTPRPYEGLTIPEALLERFPGDGERQSYLEQAIALGKGRAEDPQIVAWAVDALYKGAEAMEEMSAFGRASTVSRPVCQAPAPDSRLPGAVDFPVSRARSRGSLSTPVARLLSTVHGESPLYEGLTIPEALLEFFPGEGVRRVYLEQAVAMGKGRAEDPRIVAWAVEALCKGADAMEERRANGTDVAVSRPVSGTPPAVPRLSGVDGCAVTRAGGNRSLSTTVARLFPAPHERSPLYAGLTIPEALLERFPGDGARQSYLERAVAVGKGRAEDPRIVEWAVEALYKGADAMEESAVKKASAPSWRAPVADLRPYCADCPVVACFSEGANLGRPSLQSSARVAPTAAGGDADAHPGSRAPTFQEATSTRSEAAEKRAQQVKAAGMQEAARGGGSSPHVKVAACSQHVVENKLAKQAIIRASGQKAAPQKESTSPRSPTWGLFGCARRRKLYCKVRMEYGIL